MVWKKGTSAPPLYCHFGIAELKLNFSFRIGSQIKYATNILTRSP
uniref:Uncharacterized protein n=1 Tax=Anguilla anguilla TaxID=7936 RepID=A0A0E9RR97_ANGAN